MESGHSIERLGSAYSQAVEETRGQLQQLEKHRDDYLSVDNTLEDLPKKIKHEIMVHTLGG
jgi:hypothetical protein